MMKGKVWDYKHKARGKSGPTFDDTLIVGMPIHKTVKFSDEDLYKIRIIFYQKRTDLKNISCSSNMCKEVMPWERGHSSTKRLPKVELRAFSFKNVQIIAHLTQSQRVLIAGMPHSRRITLCKAP